MLGNGVYDLPPGKVAMIVTHLEMTTPAPLRDATLPDGVTFGQVKPTLEWYRDIFTRVGGLEWLWSGRLRAADTDVQVILDDPNVVIFTLSRDGLDEALLELDFRTKDACELAYFGVTPALIGTGAGSFLMNAAIRHAWAAPIKRLHVHTCTIDSPQALGFYIRSGFTVCKQQVEIDDDPRILGILPQSAGPHVPLIGG